MTSRPIHLSGKLVKKGEGWSIALDNADPAFADAMPVRLVLWDDRRTGTRSEVEEIARTQQLDVEIVALALSAEGKLKK
ncbi:MAG TPA: hypothetical protein VEW28_02835 [Candidatus Kapabacteria bacterium]|nr:hypothetical protein [Candidatus Kapabacteria bacterium]